MKPESNLDSIQSAINGDDGPDFVKPAAAGVLDHGPREATATALRRYPRQRSDNNSVLPGLILETPSVIHPLQRRSGSITVLPARGRLKL
jgi:hypothetical protein